MWLNGAQMCSRGQGRLKDSVREEASHTATIRSNCCCDSPLPVEAKWEQKRVEWAAPLDPSSLLTAEVQCPNNFKVNCVCAYVFNRNKYTLSNPPPIFLCIEDVIICNDYGKYYALYDFLISRSTIEYMI